MPRTGTLRASHVATYQRALTAHGFRVRLARTGKEALELVKDTLPECAVIDLRLPDMSGWDAWLAHPAVAEDLVRTIRRVLDLEIASPPSPAEALLDLMACAVCGSDQVRPTLRMNPIQYYCCKACGFCGASKYCSLLRSPAETGQYV